MKAKLNIHVQNICLACVLDTMHQVSMLSRMPPSYLGSLNTRKMENAG